MPVDEVAAPKAALPVKDGVGDTGTRGWLLTTPMYIIGWTIALYIAKCILVDKVIGALVMALASCPRGFAAGSTCAHLDRWFTTDDLGGTLSTVFISVVGFYFGQAAVKEIASMIRAKK
jgi:hypothetical protein